MPNPVTWHVMNEPESVGALGVGPACWGHCLYLPDGLPEPLPATDRTLTPAALVDYFHQTVPPEDSGDARHVALHVYQPGHDEAVAHVRWYADGRLTIEGGRGRVLLHLHRPAADPD